MAIIGTGSLARSLFPGVNAWVGADYNELEHQYKELFPKYGSNRNYEIDVTLSNTGLLTVKPEGQNVVYDDFAQGFVQTYTHIVYASGFIITREEIEDNLYMELAEKRSRMLGRSAKETKENVAANIFNRGFNPNFTGADGLELFSAAHLLEKGGTFSNELATAADLSEASLEQASIDIMDFRDGANKLIAAKPRKLVIPRALCFDAQRILNSVLQNDTANNATNALRDKGVFPEGYVVNHYLTDTDAWFILTDCPDSFKHFERRSMDVGNDTDFDSENMKFKVTERYAFGFTDVRGGFGSPGA